MIFLRETGVRFEVSHSHHLQMAEWNEEWTGFEVLRRLGLRYRHYDRHDLTTLVGALHEEGLGAELDPVVLPEPRWRPGAAPVDVPSLIAELLAKWTAYDEALYVWAVRNWRSACGRVELRKRAARLYWHLQGLKGGR